MNIKIRFRHSANNPLKSSGLIESIEINDQVVTDVAALSWLGERILWFAGEQFHSQNPNGYEEQLLGLPANSEPAPGFVYVMKDTIRNAFKIGYSKNPQYREKTLQAEVPSVELVYAYEGSMDDERALHDRFAALRLRGEWFSLTETDVTEIKYYFCEKASNL